MLLLNRCHTKYVALPNNSQYEIWAMWELLNLTLTLIITLIVTEEINLK